MANQPSKYSKFLVGAASAALVASAVAPVASAADFKDTKGNTHEEAINALSDAGVITGYTDGTFLPNKTLSRSDVVKLMGKWLVAEGSVVPTDYKTNPRFADLKSTSNDELLKYAAVVKDNGVFVGTPDGKLDATGNITRENMAVVLVRAFDRVHEIDLTTYVAGQDFKKDVTDLGKAKAEARPAIDVLDFFDITNPAAPAFNPKETTTRGQFATFLYKTTKTDFSDVTTGVVGSTEIKAVNATTVEVTFKDAVDNINSLNFKIDGLTVSNAAVKQSDNKVVVLTTAVQKGGEKYTVTLNEKAIGSFTGVSAVIPTKIDITTQSVQGKVGAQAILSADVGVKQAGIPVTFNVKADTNTTLNKDQVFEAVTNADGIAQFSYTQYAAGRDSVVAYPTGAPAVRSLGYVFWGVDTILNIEEVTTGATINNGANKTYKVTYKDAQTGKPQSGKTLNVSALENINVSSDKAQNVTVNGVKVAQLSNNTVTEAAQIVTDANGQATFTLSGNHATVTPVVFEAAYTSATGYSKNYQASALQAVGSKVTFGAIQAEYTLEMTRVGEVAAIGASNGGREYKVVVKKKDGTVAVNETVNVGFNEDLDKVIATNTAAAFIDTSGTTQVFHTGAQARKIQVKTNSKGEATFVVGSNLVNDYVTPLAWVDINTSDASLAELDNGEPTAIGPITHFQAQYLAGAALTSYNGATKTAKFNGGDTATFKVDLTNQSGLPFNAATTSISNVSYTLTNSGAADVSVNDNGVWKTVSPQRAITVSSTSDLLVKPLTDSTTSVEVTATGNALFGPTGAQKTFAFTAEKTTASFTKVGEVPTAGHTGVITAYDTTKKTVTFAGKTPVKYAGETGKTYVFKGLGGVTIPDGATGFLAILAANQVTASYTVVDDTVTFAIQGQTSGGTTEAGAAALVTEKIEALTPASTNTEILAVNNAYKVLSPAQKTLITPANVTALETAITNATTAIKSAAGFPALVDANKYTTASWANFGEAYALPTSTLENKAAALAAFDVLDVADLVSAVNVTIAGLQFTFTPVVTGSAVVFDTPLAATATTDADASITSVTVVNNKIVVAGTVDAVDAITATFKVNGKTQSVVLTTADAGTTWTTNPVSPIVVR
ncbi:S-layer homology domain-containing protein [Sporosarcina sp. FA15]|uniref:S-layer homology domain-containing protein n=1 Tax=Sporosarcina sp. FA15 TaxID=3413031 RepID=UPI003F65870B